MFYAKLNENGIAVEYPLTEKHVRNSLDSISLPQKLTNQILEPLGFAMVKEGSVVGFPTATKTHKVAIDSVYKNETTGHWERTYKLIPVPESEFENRLAVMWNRVREKRAKLMNDFQWRIERYNREVALGATPKDDITVLHQYMQTLADITNTDDPFLIDFPIEP